MSERRYYAVYHLESNKWYKGGVTWSSEYATVYLDVPFIGHSPAHFSGCIVVMVDPVFKPKGLRKFASKIKDVDFINPIKKFK